MKTIRLVLLMAACCVMAHAEDQVDQVVIVRSESKAERMARSGLDVGGPPPMTGAMMNNAKALSDAFADPNKPGKLTPDDWREVDGMIYNVGVKRNWAENANERARWRARGVNEEVMPGWELVSGFVISTNGPLVVRGMEPKPGGGWQQPVKTIRDAKSEFFRPGQTVAYYCFRRGAGVYEFGKRLEAKEAMARLAEKKKILTAESSADGTKEAK